MSILQSAIRGAKWSTLSTVITSAFQVIQYATLAMLLSPSDFGLMATVTVIVGFGQTFADMGLSNAIIYRQNATKNILSSLYWANVLASAAIFVVLVLATPLVVNFYHEPRLFALTIWGALVFLIVPFGQQFQFLLQKDLIFDTIAKIEIISAFVGLVAVVAFAYSGFGVFSIVWGQLASVAVRTVQLAATGWSKYRPELHFDAGDLDGYLNFGLYQMGERIVSYLQSNCDVIIIGKFLGPGVLGLYSLAMQLVLAPILKINPIITRIAFPIFARYQHDDDLLRAGFLKIIQFVSFSVFPLLVGMAVTAHMFVPVIFGSTWSGAIPLIQLLSILGITIALDNPSGSVYLAKGRADFGFVWNVFYIFVIVALLLITVPYGIIFLVTARAVESILSSLLYTEFFRHMISMKWRDYIGVLARPVGINLLMGGTVYLAYLALNNSGVSPLMLLSICVLAGIVSYGILQLLFNMGFVRQLKMFVVPGEKRDMRPIVYAK